MIGKHSAIIRQVDDSGQPTHLPIAPPNQRFANPLATPRSPCPHPVQRHRTASLNTRSSISVYLTSECRSWYSPKTIRPSWMMKDSGMACWIALFRARCPVELREDRWYHVVVPPVAARAALASRLSERDQITRHSRGGKKRPRRRNSAVLTS
jgi:hypothetical protein